jgi:hypothetical protein
MSLELDLSLVGQIEYLDGGDMEPGDENKVIRFEKKIAEWKRDVVDKKQKLPGDEETPTKKQMSDDMFILQDEFGGYWCEGEICKCNCSHWVVHDSVSNCWECMHDPCACGAPLVWDEKENAYYYFFLSCDGLTKRNIWVSEPTSNIERMTFKIKEKKRKEREQKEREEENCAENQKNAHNQGYCCHEHGQEAKEKFKKEKKGKKARVDGPHHCIHCDEDPCVFVQIEERLCENDDIYFDAEDHRNDPVRTNSGRRKRAYQYTAFILWEGINYRKPHYKCVEDGVRALFPPLGGNTMGYKEK